MRVFEKNQIYMILAILGLFLFISSCESNPSSSDASENFAENEDVNESDQNNENVESLELATADITNILSNSATAGGSITSAGGSTITEKGVCWDLQATPTIARQ